MIIKFFENEKFLKLEHYFNLKKNEISFKKLKANLIKKINIIFVVIFNLLKLDTSI